MASEGPDEAAPPPAEIEPAELADRLRETGPAGVPAVALVDCREPFEHAICRIEGAALVPMDETPARLDDLRALLDRAAEHAAEHDQPPELVVYCHHGVRSLRVAHFLRGKGFQTARSLAGGIDRWSEQIDPAVPKY